MAELFASGRIVDLVLALAILEGVALGLFHYRTGRGLALADTVTTLLPGMFLMLAIRSALVGQSWMWLALYLLAALVVHAVDLARRWPRP